MDVGQDFGEMAAGVRDYHAALSSLHESGLLSPGVPDMKEVRRANRLVKRLLEVEASNAALVSTVAYLQQGMADLAAMVAEMREERQERPALRLRVVKGDGA